MNTYCKTFLSTNRISHFLTAVQLYSGKWAIGTKPYNGNFYQENINYPIFDTQAEAEKYLNDNFEEV